MASFYLGSGPLERAAALGRRDAELLLAHRKALEATEKREEVEEVAVKGKEEFSKEKKAENEEKKDEKEEEKVKEEKDKKEEEKNEFKLKDGEKVFESSEAEAKRRYRRLVKGGSSGLEAFAAFNLGVLSGGCEAQLFKSSK